MTGTATRTAADAVDALVDAIGRKDVDGMRAPYAPDALLVTMSPNMFHVARGRDAVAARLAEWFAGWEESPRFSFLRRLRDGDRRVVELERTSTFEGAGWVVRQAHVMELAPDGSIRDHRIYCCGPREGGADLAAVYGGES
ncbi:MAG: nuclear transport factor 2 family protein [Actinomycetota bacterium]